MTRSRSARTAELSVNPNVRYAGAAAAVMAPVSACVATLYVLLAIAHPLVIGGTVGTIMSIVAGLSAIGLGVLAFVGYTRPPGLHYANFLLSLVIVVTIVNSGLHMVLTSDERQTTNLMLAVVAAGVAILPTSWNVGVTALAWAAWIVGITVSGGDIVHWGVAMAMATLVGQLARYGRRSSLDTAAESVSKVAELSVQDPLTGLANRRGLEVLGEEVLVIARNSDAGVSVAFIDVDGLKDVNDGHGHDRGDDLLLSVARALRASCRTTDVIARWGGDEFVVLSLGLSSSPESLEGRLLDVLRTEPGVPESMWQPSLSIGGARRLPGSDEDLESLLARADKDMYERRSVRRGPTSGTGSPHLGRHRTKGRRMPATDEPAP
jgi:diguanylate cyclase (GGDEF)-like protein